VTMRRDELRIRKLFEQFLRSSLLPLAALSCSNTTAQSSAGERKQVDAAPDHRCEPKVTQISKEYVDGSVVDIVVFDSLACGVPKDMKSVDGGCAFRVSACQELCVYGACSCKAADASCPSGKLTEGPATIACDMGCIGGIGRRPEGLARPDLRRSESALGDFFARAAHLEAASVHAFERLAATLARLGAPRKLVRAALSAADDEVRHAVMTGRLAARFESHPPPVVVEPTAPAPGLLAVAVENAVEGCARETLGALVASFQACHATDADVRAVARPIADDEIRHASLAWAILRWLAPKLSREEQDAVARAFRSAVRALESEVREPARELVEVAGLPDRDRQLSMLRALGTTLWRDPLLGGLPR
jgi:hypothetical protein